ncbi:MAG: hypothetical protein CVT49_12310 [candidate division Zixibacteria bacterium HGW-Zixibacteria-1]|nr:MAG: hypothetical protein CVT49_12310 [candidate division Zixibacteria bacterium HGW-Zixibacteria-1]
MNDDERDRELARSLFGSVGKAKATGGHVPDRNKLLQPLEHPKSVIHSFCTGCGLYLERFMISAEDRAGAANIPIPDNLDGYYMETESCSLCDSRDPLVVFKKIDDLPG